VARARHLERGFIGQLQQGEVLVTEKTDPDWQPIMMKAAGIITIRVGHTCHASIVTTSCVTRVMIALMIM
jgi:phosphoenolpyruvate synthase/pyruvate phosphate dikinase